MDQSILHEFANNVLHNLFKPLLLFFYMGFLIPILKVPFEFPKVIYQGITIYLLVAIGWHGGEELASLGRRKSAQGHDTARCPRPRLVSGCRLKGHRCGLCRAG